MGKVHKEIMVYRLCDAQLLATMSKESDGIQDMLLPYLYWHIDYSKMKGFEEQQVQEEHPDTPLK